MMDGENRDNHRMFDSEKCNMNGENKHIIIHDKKKNRERKGTGDVSEYRGGE